QLNTWVSFQSAEQPLLGQFSVSGNTREAIGAGTSSLAIGTTATTAAAGNHNHAIAEDAGSGLAAAPDLQTAFIALSTRIKALESAAP
ncbi:hypothetical protein ACNQJ9_26190, partial [Pseudomonas aeruginosa]